MSQIVIPLSPAFAAKYHDLPLIVSGALELPVLPSEFTPIWESNGGEAGPVDGFSSTIWMASSNRYGFEIQSQEGRYETFQLLLDLFQTTHVIPTQIQPITVKDYIRPEPADVATGFTTRTMIITNPPTLQQGTFMNGSERLTQGFTLRLLEGLPRSSF